MTSHPRPRLALLIPAYNAAHFLPRLLDSAARQTQPFDEMWVYDDCSTDNTALIAESYGARVIRGDVNRGCTHGKNRLAAETSCEWVHFHDADDELIPIFVERTRVWMADARYDVVLFGQEERDNTTGTLMHQGWFDSKTLSEDPRAYVIRNKINAIRGLYRREALLRAGGYDEDPLVHYNEDAAFHIRLAFEGLSFAADSALTVINHRRRDSMSGANELKCLRAHYELLRKTAALEGSERLATDIAHKLWFAIAGLAAHLDWRTADAATVLAMRLAGAASVPTSRLFRVLCYASPRLAIRIREWLIRAAKPTLRRGYPGWRAAF